ncbi:MAG: PspA/IM30 family protein [Methylococcaceae bacterium]
MNNLKRIFVSIKSQIDHVADEFENHEALAGVAIEDLQEIASKTRLHLHRVSKMSEQYQQQLSDQQEQAKLWSERAIKSRQEDEQKALQCVKRLRQVQQQIKSLEQQCQESTAQEEKIRADIELIQDQLQSLKNQKEILAARQNRASIQDSLGDNQSNSLQEVQGVFQRWEGSVVSSEFSVPDQNIDDDIFSQPFEQEEDELALKIMLDELTAQNTPSKENN